ncbi:hypothetical protein [Geitlerinema sp. PCC 7407]|uniref:hypothetical protein n=1 Tax=Geitlerinema sp. PCC 7407 TaxID=1173025 RepID=UPI00029F9F9B|nr:hypothetical protein [Geitlerinema sp. PCC 7407]AFY67579.1 hypothetical protein GEI7407_3111 [Geitlerinema sp. PCC 7407]
MSRSPNSQPGIKILLSIFGLALVVTAVLIVLKGSGLLTAIPGYVIVALVLITIGIGIITGLRNS